MKPVKIRHDIFWFSLFVRPHVKHGFSFCKHGMLPTHIMCIYVSLYSATRMCDPTARCARENEIFSKPHSMLDTLSPHVIYQIYWQHALATDKSQFTDRIFGHGPLNSIVIVRSVCLVVESPLRSSISLLRWHMRVLLLENNSHHRTILNESRSHRKELAAFGLGLFDTDLISISRMIL